MDEDSVNKVVNVLGAIADYMIFQMAFKYHLENPTLTFEEALQYAFDRLGDTQDFIPRWVEARHAEQVPPVGA